MYVAEAVHGDSAARLTPGAANEGRKQRRGSGRVDFGDEHVERRPRGSNRIRQRKVTRIRATGNVDIPGLVDGQPIRVVFHPPPRYVEYTRAEPEGLNFVTKASSTAWLPSLLSIGFATGKSSEVTVPVTYSAARTSPPQSPFHNLWPGAQIGGIYQR